MGETMFRAAAAYDRHIGRYGAELARALIDAAAVAPGDRALDVGCGPGALTSALVARAGAGRVAAVDPSPPFAEACAARNPGAEVSRRAPPRRCRSPAPPSTARSPSSS